MPAASDLKWMVSEDQVPQELLPLPTAWPVSPDDALLEGGDESYEMGTSMRRISVPVSILSSDLDRELEVYHENALLDPGFT